MTKKRKAEPRILSMPTNGTPRAYGAIKPYAPGDTVMVVRDSFWDSLVGRQRPKAVSVAPGCPGGASKTVGAHLDDVRTAMGVPLHKDIVQAVKDVLRGEEPWADHYTQAINILPRVNKRLPHPLKCHDTIARILRKMKMGTTP